MGFFQSKKKDSQEQPEQQLTWQQKLVLDMKDLVYVLAIFMLLYMLLFRVVVVIGPSMYHTLVNGDRLLLVSSSVYREPKQGDIIVASKQSFENGECIIKRVIATEGQTVDIDFMTGEVKVDGEVLQEDYIYTPTTLFEGITFPVHVTEGHVFVLGDNRMNSKDSRNPEIGLIDKREILGKAFFLLAPSREDGTDWTHRFGVID